MTTRTLQRPGSSLPLRDLLGYAGLAPFVGGLAAMALSGEPQLAELAGRAMVGYAAVIASFLGAVHWGLAAQAVATRQAARLAWGVTPALLAWLLLATPTGFALPGFALLFGLILWVDLRLLPAADDAYRRLRTRLTATAVATLLGAALLVNGAAAIGA